MKDAHQKEKKKEKYLNGSKCVYHCQWTSSASKNIRRLGMKPSFIYSVPLTGFFFFSSFTFSQTNVSFKDCSDAISASTTFARAAQDVAQERLLSNEITQPIRQHRARNERFYRDLLPVGLHVGPTCSSLCLPERSLG
eukprot:TRINITY_DN40073_c1_g1_i2.p1 TRINITY_DN40073_c1_g1~~TRINITY_DN40073_c1_g1_i2.p1  ORF type:complete len:138 (+),score=1.97 TRINITY_DN40073_c1_g1_i2:176-589(+)